MLRELDDQQDDPYDLSQLSLMDIAGGSALSRGNSYSADANSMYADFDSGNYRDDDREQEDEYGYEQSDWRGGSSGGGGSGRAPVHSSSMSSATTAASAPAAKGPKRAGSGGIYGLLLHGAEEATSQDTLAGGIVPTKSNNKVPGRVVGDNRGPAAQKAAHKTPAPAESTPRTQRAASLLATARPSDYAVNDESFEDDYAGDGVADESRSKYGQPTSLFPSRKAGPTGSRPAEARGPSGPQEFVKQMSLAPPREMTPSEKRYALIYFAWLF
jgi:hypothetical protein